MTGESLFDLPGSKVTCDECGDDIDLAGWWWHADLGAVRLDRCWECGPDPDLAAKTTRVTGVRLEDDAEWHDADEYIAIYDISDRFADEAGESR